MARSGHGRKGGSGACRGLSPAVALLALATSVTPAGASSPDGAPGPWPPPFPFGERLHYAVRWMGIGCGSMTLESFAEPNGADTEYVIVMHASSSSFFDAIYRVRTRIESRFSALRASSVRYHSVSDEKRRVKEELYEFDLAAGEVRRTKDGELQRFDLDFERVHDPLAYLYRLRVLASEPGDAASLVLATSKGPLPTTARVTELDEVRTAFGRHPAVKVVPEPEDGMLFRKSGQMAVWVGRDERRTPYRVEFDLSFGKLVAVLEAREPVGPPSDAVAR